MDDSKATSEKEKRIANGRGNGRATKRFEVSLPVAAARVLEAAAILGGYESVEAFIVEAAAEKSVRLNSEEFQQRIRAVLTHDAGNSRVRKAAPAGGGEA